MIKSKVEKAKKIIMPITGGIGRNIFATAMIREFKNSYPDKKLIIVAGCPDVFLNNPNVDRLYGLNNVQHLYEDHINDQESYILEVEPYRHPDYMQKNMHIVEAWCDLLEIKCNSIIPEIFLTKTEKDMAKAHIKTFKKPLILFQHVGGIVSDKADEQERISKLSAMYRRSLKNEVAQEIVDRLTEDGYTVGCVGMQNQFLPKGAERIQMPLRLIFSLIPYASGIISIDSFLQHASATMNVPSLVLWAGTSPEKLGYEMHTNLRRKVCATPECNRPNSYAFDIMPNGYIWDCPFGDVCTEYTSEAIIKAYIDFKGGEDNYKKIVKDFKPSTTEITASTNPVIHKNCGH